MSRTERVRVAISNNCTVSLDVKDFSPQDLQELLALALKRGTRIIFRSASEKDPTTMTTLATLANAKPGLVEFWF
jgi:hypothetical protein